MSSFPETLHVLGIFRAKAVGRNAVREYLGVRKQLVSPCMRGVRVGVHDATRRPSPHSPKQGHHPLSVREIELCIDHEPSAGVDEPGARMPRRRPVGDASIDVPADFLELHRDDDLFDISNLRA